MNTRIIFFLVISVSFAAVPGWSQCEGDFDSDGDVDGSDLAVFAADFGISRQVRGSHEPSVGAVIFSFQDEMDIPGDPNFPSGIGNFVVAAFELHHVDVEFAEGGFRDSGHPVIL